LTAELTPSGLTLADAARMMREAMRDKSYRLTPLGEDVASFLRSKRKSSADNTVLAYESTLDKLCRYFPDLRLEDFEMPVGAGRLEEWLDHYWGTAKGGTYNRHLAAVKSFFRWQVRRHRMHSNPAEVVEKARRPEALHESYSKDQVVAIIAEQDVLRDRIACRLLLHYGLRRESLRLIQFKHFDHVRHELGIFLKGGRAEPFEIHEEAFWHDLERLILDEQAEGNHCLMRARHRDPGKPMSAAAVHKWWYRCLTKAGIVALGTTAGERPHKARHTAGQIILDETGDLKLVQQTLKHKSIRTTADTYTNYENPQIAAKLRKVWEG